MVDISRSARFVAAFRKLPSVKKIASARTVEKFRKNPQLGSLHLRRFRGLDDHWLINVNRGDRIILQQISDNEWRLLDVGAHDKILRGWNRK